MEGKNEEVEKNKEEVDNKTINEVNSDSETNQDKENNDTVNGDYENLKDKHNKTLSELEELKNRHLRLQADFTNYKKRVEKEKENTYLYATGELISKILPVIDNFDRALSVKIEETSIENLYQGVEMVYKQLWDILKESGLEEIDALNQKFDPNYHHAVSQEENEDYEEDTVTEVFLKGYKLKDRIVRPSMVKVSK